MYITVFFMALITRFQGNLQLFLYTLLSLVLVMAVRGLVCRPWGSGIGVGSAGAVGVEVGGETDCMGMMGFLHFCPQLTEIW